MLAQQMRVPWQHMIMPHVDEQEGVSGEIPFTSVAVQALAVCPEPGLVCLQRRRSSPRAIRATTTGRRLTYGRVASCSLSCSSVSTPSSDQRTSRRRSRQSVIRWSDHVSQSWAYIPRAHKSLCVPNRPQGFALPNCFPSWMSMHELPGNGCSWVLKTLPKGTPGSLMLWPVGCAAIAARDPGRLQDPVAREDLGSLPRPPQPHPAG